ncbi:hypothetical protein [Variovorax sp. 38R]|uniref:hypothetical protein n=1 Tax=Variovorax sp. 38R TaxID=2774875 RepID=UPI001781095B|nr:hypothetical protein [Variovorax sp. 38R]QOF79685.1 hypothetical protein IG196_04615 [Variovorax sp. 38R]
MDSLNIYHLLILVGLVVPPALGWRFAKKLGHHGAWGLLAWSLCVPWAGIVVLAVLVFMKLPFERAAERNSGAGVARSTL